MRKILLLVLLLPLAACYKMDIRQGNLLTPEMREKLKVGMNRTQVKMVLGTPLVMDPFHPERWDYYYRFEHNGKFVDQQRMTLYFNGDTLVRLDDSRMPALPASAVQATDTGRAQP